MTTVLISERERVTLSEVLAQFAEKIESVGVFGSRATGAAQPGSDIDLVIYGDLDEKSERRLWTILEDTNLPTAVDLVVYSRIANDLLKEHIDAVAVPLFSHQDLQRARKRVRS